MNREASDRPSEQSSRSIRSARRSNFQGMVCQYRPPPALLPAPLRCLMAVVALHAGSVQAQLPSSPELHAALMESAPLARQAGLVWRTDRLWVEALRQRSPLVVAHIRGECHLGFSAYTPGQDYRWLFPALPPAQRAIWLAGMAQHELAHCADQADAAAHGSTPTGSAHQQEVLADLAFALHVDQQDPQGPALVAQLAHLRSSHAERDPVHDTAAALRCYLQQRDQFDPAGDWLTRLRAWRDRCSAPLSAPSASTDARTMAGGDSAAWAGPAGRQASAPQPVATRR